MDASAPRGLRSGSLGEPGVSVVVCTFNRSGMLRDTLLSFRHAVASAPPAFPYELIVVDNGSTDETGDVVSAAMGEGAMPLRYLLEPVRGLSVARNSGIRASRHEIVAFVDDDVFVGAGWLHAIARAFAEHPGIACVGGNTVPRFEAGRPPWIDDGLLRYYGSTGSGEVRREMRYPEHPFGVNMAMRRSLFEAIGGFNPSLGRKRYSLLSNEEAELFRRAGAAGFRTLYEPSAVLEHRIPPTRAQKGWILSRSYWQGVSDAVMRTLDEPPSSRGQLAREGFTELAGLLREARGGFVSPRRIRWHLHAMRFEARLRLAYRLGRSRRLLAAALGFR
jgi:glycosyltransferase involved in cell wall biosynthesis